MGAPQEHEGGEGFVEAVFDDVRDSSLGVEFQARGDGVAVSEVVPGSRASRVAGLHAGMVLIGVYGKDGRGRSTRGLDYSHVMELIKNKKACDHVKLRFRTKWTFEPSVAVGKESIQLARTKSQSERSAYIVLCEFQTIHREPLGIQVNPHTQRVEARDSCSC